MILGGARRSGPLVAGLLLLVAACLFARGARAHAIGVSQGRYALAGSEVTASLVLRADDAALAAPALDADGDGHLSQAEVARGRDAASAAFVAPLAVSADGAACPGTLESVALDPPDGLRVEAAYACPSPPRRLHLRFGFLDRLASDHRHLASVVVGDRTTDTLVMIGRPDLDVDTTGAPQAPQAGFLLLLRMGIEHILTGYDHLVFLFGLVLVGGRLRSLVGVITAFTIAHSLTLGCAALGVFTPPARVIEPAIALSIAYVGVENLFVKSAAGRWRITFPFGLVHGFGFASALRAIDLPRAKVPLLLVSFNLGVEIGQLLVLLAVLPLLVRLRRVPWFPGAGVKVLSALVAAAGAIWFVQRVLHPA